MRGQKIELETGDWCQKTMTPWLPPIGPSGGAQGVSRATRTRQARQGRQRGVERAASRDLSSHLLLLSESHQAEQQAINEQKSQLDARAQKHQAAGKV